MKHFEIQTLPKTSCKILFAFLPLLVHRPLLDLTVFLDPIKNFPLSSKLPQLCLL